MFRRSCVWMTLNCTRGRRCEEQCSELGCLADYVASGVHSIDLGRKSEPSETTMHPVLSIPGRAFVFEIEAVSMPGVTDEVMNGTETIERATELTAEERVEALSNRGG